MADPHVDQDMRELGTISWFAGQGPRANQVPYVGDCDHSLQRVVGWGPDEKHYELCECGDCGARAWSDGRARDTTPWLVPAVLGKLAYREAFPEVPPGDYSLASLPIIERPKRRG
ncbi:hypothetical protein CH296_28235 [Rhodococcus sp. 14-2496-1d]|uniref:hypothetical protein n=1 Tax=Rhodococcus sp. 14-2496-1d TaxID=2023146 RepID=UPI000B9C4F01|nr:hypothetical protein [Rhodococcus sp. 14-2496-1d]OZF24602.1 hypothetical protein CH296_28235 [Rhodococcus sp. 14-2496-1d]